jgi:predicted RNA methylase
MTAKLVARLAEAEQDFEWYPTTEEIIAALVADVTRDSEYGYRHNNYSSVLDIGAGNGKVLLALRERAKLRDMHAIEKSQILCEQLHPDILIVGTEFQEQSLLSKHVDVVFCNPPYSEFEEWATKIIRESASKVIYLVLPIRWENSTAIQDALRYRDAAAHVVGQYDFQHAEDRAARARVHLLRIDLTTKYGRNGDHKDDAFERFFAEEFADLIGKFEAAPSTEAEKKLKFGGLVVGPTYQESLISLYEQELAKVQRNFDLVSKLDADLLREFNVTPKTIMACLKTRLAGLRTEYWHELFAHLDKVTDRLTSGSRKKLLDVLNRHVHVDFTLSNVFAVLSWVVKNANLYIDSQLLDTYELMVAKANVVLYKSNQRTWVEDRWRYNEDEIKNTHFSLDYRIVTHRLGGCKTGDWDRGLQDSAADFLGDLLTLASNLGFKCSTNRYMVSWGGRKEWEPGERYTFEGTDRKGRPCVLYDVRAFLNGNLHLRLHKSLILALNVEHGRLKGWLRSRAEAVEELGDLAAAEYFLSNMRLTSSNLQMLPPPLAA